MTGAFHVRETGSTETAKRDETGSSEVRKMSPENNVHGEATPQEISEGTYRETIENVISRYGEVMPEEQLERIEREKEAYKPIVMSAEAYHRQFPDVSPSVLGHCDAAGRIYLKEGSPDRINHVTTHEALHLTSYKEIDNRNGSSRFYQTGIREVGHDLTGIIEDRNRGLNEGVTELYALKEMMNRGEISSAESVCAYPEAQVKAYQLERIVGSEVMQKAYFGGDVEQLKAEVNRMSFGDERAWDRFSENVDKVTYGKDPEEIRRAKQILTLQMAKMTAFKEAEQRGLL